MLGAPVALLVGALTDVTHRTRLFVAVVCLGEAPCLATAYVTTYGQLFACRALTGISVGGCVPLLYSLLGDFVPPTRRAAVAAVVSIAQGAGIAIGQIIAGYIGAQSGWRLPFVLVAVPALSLAILCGFVVEEPKRGCQDGNSGPTGGGASPQQSGEYTEKLEWGKAKAMFGVRSNQLAFAQGLPGCVPWGVINTFFTGALFLFFLVATFPLLILLLIPLAVSQTTWLWIWAWGHQVRLLAISFCRSYFFPFPISHFPIAAVVPQPPPPLWSSSASAAWSATSSAASAARRAPPPNFSPL